MAARLAKTPLAIADAHVPGAPIMFANAAFAALVQVDAGALVGRLLGTLSMASACRLQAGDTTRFELAVRDEGSFHAALSTAAVLGPDGQPFCLLCSLIDARGEGADAAIARDAELLTQVAAAAGELMRESAVAANLDGSSTHPATASDIALDAVERVAHVTVEDR